MDYTITTQPIHYTVSAPRLEYTIGEQVDYTVERVRLYYEAKDT